MQQYNIFQAIPMSFYSKKLYRDIALNWGGKVFLYLLLLTVISSIFTTYILQRSINEAYQTFSPKIFPQIPEMVLKDGKLSTPEKRPYFIVTPDSKEIIAVIDTSGKYTSPTQANAPLLATETQIMMRSDDQSKAYTYPAQFTEVISASGINQFMVKFLAYLWVPIFFMLLFGLYIYRIIQALIYALFGKIFASVMRVQLSYGQIVQIAIVAVTPVIILSGIQYIFYQPFKYEMLCYFLLAMAYLFYGILANKKLS